jgi:hypothetical protein
MEVVETPASHAFVPFSSGVCGPQGKDFVQMNPEGGRFHFANGPDDLLSDEDNTRLLRIAGKLFCAGRWESIRRRGLLGRDKGEEEEEDDDDDDHHHHHMRRRRRMMMRRRRTRTRTRSRTITTIIRAAITTMAMMMMTGGYSGPLGTGAATNDPVFWSLHPIFDRAWHLLLLSDKYQGTYDLTWTDGTCQGSGWNHTQVGLKGGGGEGAEVPLLAFSSSRMPFFPWPILGCSSSTPR